MTSDERIVIFIVVTAFVIIVGLLGWATYSSHIQNQAIVACDKKDLHAVQTIEGWLCVKGERP